MFTRQEFQITRQDELDLILRLPSSTRVVIELPSLQSDETESWQCEINALLRKTCGCGEATAVLLSVMAALVVVGHVFWNSVKIAAFLSFAIGVGCFVLAVVIGKVFGQWRGRRRLAASVCNLQTILMHRASEHGLIPRPMPVVLQEDL